MADIKKTDPYWIIKPIWDSKGYMQGYEVFRSISSADVAPVRHGHWVFNQEDMTLHCSRCDEVFRFEETEKDECLDFMEYAKYCLACGAVMDEEVD